MNKPMSDSEKMAAYLRRYEITDEQRPEMRKGALWMEAAQSWLDSVRPVEARQWMEGDQEELLCHLDSLMQNYADLLRVGVDEVDAAIQVFSPQTEEEITEPFEEEEHLTPEEYKQLKEIFRAAHEGWTQEGVDRIRAVDEHIRKVELLQLLVSENRSKLRKLMNEEDQKPQPDHGRIERLLDESYRVDGQRKLYAEDVIDKTIQEMKNYTVPANL